MRSAGSFAGESAPAPPETASGQAKSAWLALLALLLGTFCGTLNNNIVNVPLKEIMRSLRVPLSEGVLVVVAFNLTFAVLMPLTGWLGDRFGRRRVFLCALITLGCGAVGAAVSPTLPILVAFRVVQGAATAAILPTVMSIIRDIFGPRRRARALGWWAAVNGLGQAVGPPLGGLLVGVASWRAIFWPVVPLTLVAAWLTVRFVPSSPARLIGMSWAGALTLTIGSALLIGAATAVPKAGALSAPVIALAAAGIGALAWFWRTTREDRRPFVPRRMLKEVAFLRSSLAVFAQMFCLASTLLAVPLYLTKQSGVSAAHAGALIFGLPVAMTVLAPVAGVVTERLGPRRVIRGGLVALAAAEGLLGLELASHRGRGIDLVATLLVAGAGVAFVQTPSAMGVTRSEGGRHGSALGLFNLLRFAGSALGAAWVAVALNAGQPFGMLFAVSGCVAVLGVAGTFAGTAADASPMTEQGDVVPG